MELHNKNGSARTDDNSFLIPKAIDNEYYDELDRDDLEALFYSDEEKSSQKGRQTRLFSSRATVRILFVGTGVGFAVLIFLNLLFRRFERPEESISSEGSTSEELLAKQKQEYEQKIGTLQDTINSLQNDNILADQTKQIELQTKRLEEKERNAQQLPPLRIPTSRNIPVQKPVTTVVQTNPILATTITVDPAKLSKQVAASGHYRANNNWNKSVALPPSKKETKQKPLVSPPITPIMIANKDRLLTWGTRVPGILETKISWEGNLGAIANKNFMIKLSEHLRSPSGKVVLPAGTKIIANIISAKVTGEIELVAKYFQLEPKNNSVVILPIPKNAVLIQDSDRDGLLMADSERKSTLGRDALAAILGGAAKMTDLTNRPQSTSFNNWNQGSSSTVTNNDPNYGAAFAGGVAKELNRRMSQRNAEEIRRLEKEAIIFILRENTRVIVYINENFKPLQHEITTKLKKET